MGRSKGGVIWVKTATRVKRFPGWHLPSTTKVGGTCDLNAGLSGSAPLTNVYGFG